MTLVSFNSDAFAREYDARGDCLLESKTSIILSKMSREFPNADYGCVCTKQYSKTNFDCKWMIVFD